MFSRTSQAVVLIVFLLVGGFALYHRDQIQHPGDLVALVTEHIQLRFGSVDDVWHEPVQSPRSRPDDRIRVGCLRLPSVNSQRTSTEQFDTISYQLTRVLQEMDVVTLLQDEPQPELLNSVVSKLNQQGGAHKFFVDTSGHGYAVLFDSRRVQLEQDYFYTVQDPDSLFERPPLVAWFRCLSENASPNKCFTFTLVSFQQGSRREQGESSHFRALFRAVRGDGRGEDDILLVGDVNSDVTPNATLNRKAGLFQTVSAQSGLRVGSENILVQPSATIELGRSERLDLIRMFNWDSDALARWELLDPVWAEFSTIEGARPKVEVQPKWNRPVPAPANPPGYENPAKPMNKTAEFEGAAGAGQSLRLR